MPVKVLLQPPAPVEKPSLSQGHGDNNYKERYHDNREQGELVGIITEGGNSKGYGFVTFHCKKVVKRLLDTEEGVGLVLKGRNLYVGPARQ